LFRGRGLVLALRGRGMGAAVRAGLYPVAGFGAVKKPHPRVRLFFSGVES
jgi:hypothetical protein